MTTARFRPGRPARFRIWAVLTLLLLLGQPGWCFLIGYRTVFWMGLTLFIAALAAFAVLLVTTPPDALRLPARQSWWLIFGGMLWLQGWALGASGRGDHLAAAGISLALLGVMLVLMEMLRRSDKALWWGTLLAWNPLATLLPLMLAVAQP